LSYHFIVISRVHVRWFLRARASIYHILATVILSVHLSCLSRPGTVPKPGEIETLGFHHMIAYGL